LIFSVSYVISFNNSWSYILHYNPKKKRGGKGDACHESHHERPYIFLTEEWGSTWQSVAAMGFICASLLFRVKKGEIGNICTDQKYRLN